MAIVGLANLGARLSRGATVTLPGPTNTTSNWEQNWTNATVSDGAHVLPAASVPDLAIINQGRTLQVDTAVGVAPGDVIVANTSKRFQPSVLEVNPGGTLATGNLTISQNADEGIVNVQGGALASGPVHVNAHGTFNLKSGSFTNSGVGPRSIFTDTNGDGGVVNILGGSFTSLGAAPTDILRLEADAINISGGTVNLTGGQVLLADTTALTIIGDAADISMDRLNLNNASRAATVNFNFGSTGVSPIQNNSFLHLSNATLNIDGAHYTGDVGTFDLFSAANVASIAPTVNVTGFGAEGIDYTFEQSTSDNVVRLNVLQRPLTPTGELLDVFPSSSQAALNPGNWDYWQTNHVDLSGSTWEPRFDEKRRLPRGLENTTKSSAPPIRIGRFGSVRGGRSTPFAARWERSFRLKYSPGIQAMPPGTTKCFKPFRLTLLGTRLATDISITSRVTMSTARM